MVEMGWKEKCITNLQTTVCPVKAKQHSLELKTEITFANTQ